MSDVVPDADTRSRIRDDLGTTLFVEAGAGSGKTTALVERVIELVTTDLDDQRVELRHIAAITFTEKAGTELRDRIRQRLEQVAIDDPSQAERCRTALDQLDAAAIGTLHSFAQRLLTEHPVEAGLPPRVEVLDEVSSSVEFDRRWATDLDTLLADPELERPLLLLLAAGVPDTALQALAVAFEQSWDLVEERVPAEVPEVPTVATIVEPALARVDASVALAEHCSDAGDSLAVRLEEIGEHVAWLRSIDDEVDLLEALSSDSPRKRPSFRVGNLGQKTKWGCDKAEVKQDLLLAEEALDGARGAVAEACIARLGAAMRALTLRGAEARRTAGCLQFHDLLVLARSLLRHPEHGATVRAQLHARYQRILLDEFQDTDPIQIELAVRIAAADPSSDAAGAALWDQVPVGTGRLFVVGDPKQSIYRFRRADISVFLAARDRFGREGGGAVKLDANFRTAPPVLEWANEVFSTLMSEEPETEVPVPSQPEYVPLQPVRDTPPEGPPVAVIGRDSHPSDFRADNLRTAEAIEVAATVQRAVAEGWSVDAGNGAWRPCELGDITILVPARTSLPFLEDALEAAGIAFRAESSSLVYATRPVRDLLMVLRAVDDPTDYHRIVSALRTPLLGCGDDDLTRFCVEREGRWSYLAEQPESVPHDDPVLAGLRFLRSIHDERRWRAPSELLDRIARERRAMELGFAEGRPRDVWRRLRFVIDQSRAWSEATGGTLRAYLHWVDQQTVEGARVAEAVLPETDDKAVRIMTIHAAKGLEFPITIVSGLSTAPKGRRAPAEVVFPATGGVGYRLSGQVQTQEFAIWSPIDEQMAFDERVRLLYVACTRACDHLVVSLVRSERKKPPPPGNRTNAELLVDGMGERLADLPDAAGAEGAALAAVTPIPPTSPTPLAEWAAARKAVLEVAGRPVAVAATALTDEGLPDVEPDPGLEKRPRDLDLPPWLKGRYGTAVGRAVHGVLQVVDLATGEGLDAAVAAQSQAEAIPGQADDVRALARAALGSPSVAAAASRPHWREVYVCTPLEGGRLLEGYIDLLWRSEEGLVVVDHKTASTSDPAELDRRVMGYRLQGAAYALTVAATTGEPVVRVTFVFLTPTGAVERDLLDLDAAMAEVRAQVTRGTELVVG